MAGNFAIGLARGLGMALKLEHDEKEEKRKEQFQLGLIDKQFETALKKFDYEQQYEGVQAEVSATAGSFSEYLMASAKAAGVPPENLRKWVEQNNTPLNREAWAARREAAIAREGAFREGAGLTPISRELQQQGIELTAPPSLATGEAFTLKPGEKRFGPSGEVIASVAPDKSATAPSATQEKINAIQEANAILADETAPASRKNAARGVLRAMGAEADVGVQGPQVVKGDEGIFIVDPISKTSQLVQPFSTADEAKAIEVVETPEGIFIVDKSKKTSTKIQDLAVSEDLDSPTSIPGLQQRITKKQGQLQQAALQEGTEDVQKRLRQEISEMQAQIEQQNAITGTTQFDAAEKKRLSNLSGRVFQLKQARRTVGELIKISDVSAGGVAGFLKGTAGSAVDVVRGLTGLTTLNIPETSSVEEGLKLATDTLLQQGKVDNSLHKLMLDQQRAGEAKSLEVFLTYQMAQLNKASVEGGSGGRLNAQDYENAAAQLGFGDIRGGSRQVGAIKRTQRMIVEFQLASMEEMARAQYNATATRVIRRGDKAWMQYSDPKSGQWHDLGEI